MSSLPELSVQLYSVRDAFAGDPAGTLARLAGIGLTRLEPFGLVERASVLESVLPDSGLAAPTTHQQLVGVGDLDEVFDIATRLGIGTVIEPYVEPARWTSPAGVSEIAAELSAAAAAAARRGLRVGYHNHWFELESSVDGRHALEAFADELDPAVVLQVDTYWAAVGGADVPALLGRLGDRVRALHLKDGPISQDPDAQLPLGQGAMPVPDVVAAATSVEVPVVEFDGYAGDLFEGIAQSLAYARGLEVR